MRASGTDSGERRLAGLQTTGRSYRNLSAASFEIASEVNVAIRMRDGIDLHADVHRPAQDGRFPALVAISPYPRQIQHLGLPLGFIEAGQTDFFVPRGYAHVIANCRGTGGSGGTYELMGPAELGDVYDLIEWVAAQPWCDGRVGMIGVSYFAVEQFRAALAAPPHLGAIFPWSGTVDWYREIFWHGGILSGRFAGRYLNAIGMADRKNGDFFRGPALSALNRLLQLPALHRRLARAKNDPIGMLNRALILPYAAHPWDDIYYNIAVEHPFYDDFWRERDMTDRLGEIRIPVYLGADWENVAFHLQTPFLALERLAAGTPYRVAMTPRGGLQWPWETLHVEALAWFDHWLKGRDTGIMEGPPIRYYVEGAEEWRAAECWPLPETRFTELALRADGGLGIAAGAEGARDYLNLPAALDRARNTNPPPLPSSLSWDTSPFADAMELVGPLTLRLCAASTAIDADWIVKLLDIAPDGTARNLTQGWLRASHRALDPRRSKPYHPWHPHERAEPLTPNQKTWFEIAILPTAHRFRPGHRLRFALTSDDSDGFAMQGVSHIGVGLPARHRVFSDSRLRVPLVAGSLS